MRLLLVLLAGALAAGCTALDEAPAAFEPAVAVTAAPEADAPPAGPRVPYEFRTLIRDEGFEHPRLDAATQATILWRNVGNGTHSVVSDDGAFAGSGPIAPGGLYGFTFLAPGDFAYHCRYHPEMKGLVVVR